MVALALFFLSLMLMLAAVLSIMRAQRLEQLAKVNQRLEQVAFLSIAAPGNRSNESGLISALSRWLNRVGFQIEPVVALGLATFTLLSGLFVWTIWGGLAAVLWWALAGTFSVFIPQIRYQQKINKLVSQIPLFIDQVIRGLVTGRNVEGAIKLAMDDLEEPLRGVIDRAQKSVELGADLGEALRDAANFYDVKELHMLALAIHTSRVYGGSPREMLESIVNLIRQREQGQRELRAMTGETRVTAWVLGTLPITIAGYMIWRSPSFISVMWNDSTGHALLMVSAGFQALGALILWRMIKSI
jgi:tight adherence protein B